MLTSSVAIAAPTGAAADVVWELSIGANYSSGKYGAVEETEVLYAPVTMRANSERWRFEVAVPYISIEGPEGSVSGGVVIPGMGPVVSNSGLGDVVVSAGYQLIDPSQGRARLELGGNVKLPTADDNLGTGETDTSVQLQAHVPLGDRFTAIGSAGYQWYGDPDAYEIDDGMIGSLGLNYAANDRVNVGVVANYRASYFDSVGEQVMASPYFNVTSDEGWTLTGYASAGLSDGSPDFAAGLILGRRFGQR
jgi:hypothetical protein